MGAGRKNKTHPKEKSNAKWTVNCSASARNITKNELAAVIFGCKHHTMQECLHKLLFGLPANHFSYVKHITPGLPLFLFNYSDRTLHGIFEATSLGQMNIDPHAWLGGEEAECTPYGAQVRVRVLRRCRPLREEEFKPVMAKNYYEEKLFWFELDRRQANRLTKLFSASPLTENTPHRPVVARSNINRPVVAQSNNMFDALPSSDVDEAVESKDLKLEELPAPPNQFILQQDSWHGSSSTTEMNLKESHQHSYASVLLNKNASVAQQWCHGIENGGISIIRDDCRGAEDCSDELNVECASSPPNTWEERISTGDGVKKFEACLDVPNMKCGSSFSEDRGENKNIISDGLVRDIEHSEYHSVVWKLIGEVEELKVSHLEQQLRINSLEHDLDISKMEIHHLKERCNLLESGPSLRRNYCEIEGYESLNSTVNELVFIVGGFDGCSWLPVLSSYSPSKDLVKPLVSTTVRSYASAAKLNGEIYVFGGVQSGVWYDTVELYNPTNGQCIQRPSLNRRKGSSAGASLCEKIFVTGGGDGTKCFSEVEELDLRAGRWILVSPMLERRYAPGAVDMNGSLYVAGGFDGIDYLRSLERFDPRERSWTRLGSMSAKRGCHSLVAFNEKLYALGGYDGTGMVATVEVFDPRLGSWMREEPMKKSRGNFGSVVLGGKMYVIGGVDGDGEVLDAVEYYEEGRGWQVAGLRALGKRSFFSAFVL
ncbi:uncharacterized protein [Primulina huaijiensis]|uniref:uncharacterized protein isoform X2 n=1 Tax=Primulina huaijiensis TaxID=1492673 RepID=UPI003CC761BB